MLLDTSKICFKLNTKLFEIKKTLLFFKDEPLKKSSSQVKKAEQPKTDQSKSSQARFQSLDMIKKYLK